MTNLVVSKDCKCRIPRKRLESIIRQAIVWGDLKSDSQFQLLITTDENISELNRKYRGIEVITDILTFPSEVPGSSFLGDIVIDIQQAARQKGSHSLDVELVVLFIHGILHLIGYDHMRKDDRNRMLIKENEYLSFIKENETTWI
jgi:probable rRNA maturation factor